MESKNKTFKTRNTKNISVAPIPAKEVAELLGCSESTVKKVRTGNRTGESVTGLQVRVFDELIAEGSSLLIKEVVKRVKFR